MATIERAIPVGGASLNFKVVGGTAEPANPKENTIWVNTDVEVTGWAFAADEPADPVHGSVWIKTIADGSVAFNALKKNAINVCPIGASQWQTDRWVDRKAKIYQNGAWLEWWNGEFYTPGNEWVSVTGGWVKSGDGSINRTESYMELKPEAGTAPYTVYLTTANKVDISIFGTLGFEVSGAGTYTDIYLQVMDLSGNVVASTLLGGMSDNINVSRGYYNIDIRGLSGEHSVGIKMYNGASLTPVSLKIYNILAV